MLTKRFPRVRKNLAADFSGGRVRIFSDRCKGFGLSCSGFAKGSWDPAGAPQRVRHSGFDKGSVTFARSSQGSVVFSKHQHCRHLSTETRYFYKPPFVHRVFVNSNAPFSKMEGGLVLPRERCRKSVHVATAGTENATSTDDFCFGFFFTPLG